MTEAVRAETSSLILQIYDALRAAAEEWASSGGSASSVAGRAAAAARGDATDSHPTISRRRSCGSPSARRAPRS